MGPKSASVASEAISERLQAHGFYNEGWPKGEHAQNNPRLCKTTPPLPSGARP